MRDYAEIASMSIEDAATYIENSAIQASMLIEKRESKETYGNGWHAAQNIGNFAAMEMATHWRNREEAETFCKKRWKVSLDDIRYRVTQVANPAPRPSLFERLLLALRG